MVMWFYRNDGIVAYIDKEESELVNCVLFLW